MTPRGPTGAWRQRAIEWQAEPKDSCQVCGRLIPARRWLFASGTRTVTACTPECETLYFDYLLPLRESRQEEDRA